MYLIFLKLFNYQFFLIVGVAQEEDAVVDARWQFSFIMRYHNHGFVLAATEGFDDVFYKTAVAVVESVERFIENQQFRILEQRLVPGERGAVRRWRASGNHGLQDLPVEA